MSVENHRHCQATVLGATGTSNGNGTTWSTINGLNLPYIDKVKTNWKNLFLSNGNITDDLADILSLINYSNTYWNTEIMRIDGSLG